MKIWMKRTIYGLVGATIALGGLAACGHRAHSGWGSNATPEQSAEWRGKMVERVARKLELNADQKAKLTVLGDTMHTQRMALRGEGEPREQIKALIAGDKLDRAKAQSLVQEKTEAVRQGSPAVIAAMGDFYDSLTPAQQQQVREFMERRRGRR